MNLLSKQLYLKQYRDLGLKLVECQVLKNNFYNFLKEFSADSEGFYFHTCVCRHDFIATNCFILCTSVVNIAPMYTIFMSKQAQKNA